MQGYLVALDRELAPTYGERGEGIESRRMRKDVQEETV